MSVVEDLDNVTAGEAVMVIYCTRQKLLREHIEMVGCTKKVKKVKKQKAQSKKQKAMAVHLGRLLQVFISRNHDRNIRPSLS